MVHAHASAAIAILRRDVAVYFSYRTRLVAQVVSALFALTLFYYVSRLVTVASFGSPDAYFAFVAVGLVTLQVVQSALALPMSLREELVAGTFERLVVSPFGPVGSICSMVLFPLLQALLVGLLVLLLGALLYELPVHWATAPLALPVAALGALAFAGFGVLFAAVVVVFKHAPGVAWVVAGISLLAGFYFPVEELPGWVRWTSEVQPFTPVVDLMRHLLVGAPVTEPEWLSMAKAAGFAAVLLPLSVLALRAAIAIGRRRATIAEY
jgi:ABC-2 type transport system permease protein